MSDQQPDWHGWEFPGIGTIHIGPVPTRKSICLYTIQGSVMDVHAYFRTEDHARTLLTFLDQAFRQVAS